MILELGCGGKHHPGVTHCLDNRFIGCGADGFKVMIKDLNDDISLPYNDLSFTKVYATNLLEHLWDVEGLLKEVKRILKPGCLFELVVPHAYSINALNHLEHKRFFTLQMFINQSASGGYCFPGWELVKAEYYVSNKHDFECRLSAWVSNKLGKWAEIIPCFRWLLNYTGLRVVLKKK